MQDVKSHNKPLLSVVIPCFNDAAYIEQAVESALQQTYPHIEIIIVDDGSDALTKTVLHKIAPKITQLITQENQGQSNARNEGITQAKGDYILVLDSDDFFEPSFCEKAMLLFEQDTSIKIVTSYVTRLLPNGRTEAFKPIGGTIKNFLKYNCAMGSALFKKMDWEVAGGYDEAMTQGFEDWEFYIRLMKDGGKAHVIQEPLFNYRVKEHSTSTRANKIKYTLLQYIYFKHKDLYVSNFELFVNHLLYKIETEEISKNNKENKVEFKLGNAILRPFRYVKSLLSK